MRNLDGTPRHLTVGELRQMLDKMPDDTPIVISPRSNLRAHKSAMVTEVQRGVSIGRPAIGNLPAVATQTRVIVWVDKVTS